MWVPKILNMFYSNMLEGCCLFHFHSLPSLSLINICSLGLWPISYGLENKPLWNKQAAGRLWHFSLSSWRNQVMYSCLPNEHYFFIQSAGDGHRLLLNIFSCQITFDDWKHSPYYWEDNGLIFKKYLVQTPLITTLFFNGSFIKYLRVLYGIQRQQIPYPPGAQGVLHG